MTRMKHLLRKLHIGSEPRPIITSSDPSPTSSSTIEAASVDNNNRAAEEEEFSFLEEEFQVQLALAISASDPNGFTDPESLQIKAAKRISLGCSGSVAAVTNSDGYWNYNFVNYDEKVMDGFYDVYGITSRLVTDGKMPSLDELQIMPVTGNIDYEVILVNRGVDIELQQLEQRALLLSLECEIASHGPISIGTIQKIADLVVNRMGGPVSDVDDMLRKWILRRSELQSSLNSVVLPLGCLDVGLSRHRALLFKVLADRILLPCMLVKGSYYTGTDEGAVNLIKINNESEYIIDLMGAPGMLIPSEASIRLPYAADERVITNIIESPGVSGLVATDTKCISPGSLAPKPSNGELAQAFRFEHDFGRLPPLPKSREESSGDSGRASTSAQKMKVNDVSECVLSAAKNPRFAQRLHAVLLENGASPPVDLSFDMDQKQEVTKGPLANFMSKYEQSLIRSTSVGVKSVSAKKTGFIAEQGQCIDGTSMINSVVLLNDSDEGNSTINKRNGVYPVNLNASDKHPARSCQGKLYASTGDHHHFINNCDSDVGKIGIEDRIERLETPQDCQPIAYAGHCETISTMLRGAEWEIQWDDLQIGDRIGIGSYGEVFHADLNGTEVAVKRFLDQDLTGDALVQFKCEVEIMLRLRHPNVVLFMGAVTRPPNLSILTEYLPRKSLYRLLHNPSHHIDERRRIRMAFDVAKGMNYLHTSHPTIVHRDLKSPNLLVDRNWNVKVCDFGLSRLKHQTFLSSKSTAGTPEWMAPEVLKNEPSNEKSDIFSYGVILWELLTMRVPWSELNAMQVVGAVGFQNRRLDIPADADPTIAQLITDCWQNEQQLRPCFAQIMQRLRRVTCLHTRRSDPSGQTPL